MKNNNLYNKFYIFYTFFTKLINLKTTEKNLKTKKNKAINNNYYLECVYDISVFVSNKCAAMRSDLCCCNVATSCP